MHQAISRPLAIAGILFVLTAALFWRIGSHEFINYDDQLYLTDNRVVQLGLTKEGVGWAFGNLVGNGTYWHPLTWLSHMTDVQLFGMNAGRHHQVSLLFHCLNSVLVFLVLQRLTKKLWPSALVAALFAWHPLQVDSVAWLAERKNLLSTFFSLLAVCAYGAYVEAGKRNKAFGLYGAVVGLFACALMSKPSVVTLPCVLLLLDVWPLRRIEAKEEITSLLVSPKLWRLVAEKLPLFLMSVAAGVLTILAHRKLDLITPAEHLSLGTRLANSAVGYLQYLRKAVWPGDLAVYYPMPTAWPVALIAAGTVVLLTLSFLSLRSFEHRRYLFTGWFWFFGTLLPFIGIVQVNDQAMADRFAYFPLIGLFIAVVWTADQLLQRTRNKALTLGISATALLVTAAAASSQVNHWKNSETLFRHALAVTKENNIAHINLGAALEAKGDLEGALEQYKAAVTLKTNSMAESNLGVVLAKMGRLDEAFPYFARAVEINPDNADARSNYGLALTYAGKVEESITQFREALRVKPEHAQAHHNLANALSQAGKTDEAVTHYEAALKLQPGNFDICNNFGFTLLKAGRTAEAEKQFLNALKLAPNHAQAHYNLGNLRLKAGQNVEAREHFTAAINARPTYAEAHYQLAQVLQSQGELEKAQVHFAEAARLKQSP